MSCGGCGRTDIDNSCSSCSSAREAVASKTPAVLGFSPAWSVLCDVALTPCCCSPCPRQTRMPPTPTAPPQARPCLQRLLHLLPTCGCSAHAAASGESSPRESCNRRRACLSPSDPGYQQHRVLSTGVLGCYLGGQSRALTCQDYLAFWLRNPALSLDVLPSSPPAAGFGGC